MQYWYIRLLFHWFLIGLLFVLLSFIYRCTRLSADAAGIWVHHILRVVRVWSVLMYTVAGAWWEEGSGAVSSSCSETSSTSRSIQPLLPTAEALCRAARVCSYAGTGLRWHHHLSQGQASDGTARYSLIQLNDRPVVTADFMTPLNVLSVLIYR